MLYGANTAFLKIVSDGGNLRAWTEDPAAFIINPRYLIPGPNTLVQATCSCRCRVGVVVVDLIVKVR